MAWINQHEYYHNSDNSPEELNWGSYQYVSLANIVRNFKAVFVGPNKDINHVDENEIRYHAKHAIGDLHMDALREVCIAEITTADDLTIILPHDYVNWVRISVYEDGVLKPLNQNVSTNYAKAHLQDHEAKILVDEDGNMLTGTSTISYDRITGNKKTEYLGPGSMTGRQGYNCDGGWYFEYNIGSRFGLQTETANKNATFRINKREGVINFSSQMADKEIILEYISDGMENGDDSSIVVNKMFRTFMNAYIKWMIIDNTDGTPKWKRDEARRQKTAAWRNARIRISDIKPSRLMQILRGRAKWIK